MDARLRNKILLFPLCSVAAAGYALLRKQRPVASAAANPAESFDQAVDLVRKMQRRDSPIIREDAQTRFLSHGKKTETVYVFFHGYTNNPRQFLRLGRKVFADGSNVLLPRLVYHGYKDQFTTEHRKLTAEHLVEHAMEVIDAASGLGNRVVICGLSLGGLVAAWGARHHPRVERAVLLSPCFGYGVVPHKLHKPMMNLILQLRNRMHFWQGRSRQNPQPFHTYPQYSTHALAQFIRLSLQLNKPLRKGDIPHAHVCIFMNANDRSISNCAIKKLALQWQKYLGSRLELVTLPASLLLAHDFVDPEVNPENEIKAHPLILKHLQ